jgi:predicted nucleic acid-binding protein
MLVLDASVILAACLAGGDWTPFNGHDIVTPPLGMSEACSALHELLWRGDLEPDDARLALEHLAASPVRFRTLEGPIPAWEIAESLGWAKTYDAEYIALALALGCRLVTLDERLKRGAARLIQAVGPRDL